jgi:hypothetical protein
MTQQYILGELSLLLAELQPAPTDLLDDALHDLRRGVELSPLPMLPRLAQEAMTLTDMICWTALDQGNVSEFCRYVSAAVSLRNFTVNASLLR